MKIYEVFGEAPLWWLGAVPVSCAIVMYHIESSTPLHDIMYRDCGVEWNGCLLLQQQRKVIETKPDIVFTSFSFLQKYVF